MTPASPRRPGAPAKILAVITARGGSKGLPRKNVLPLAGKPLIAWTIEAARGSRYIDRTVVSTDDEEIADVSRAYGGDVPFMRPSDLANDSSRQSEVLLHALRVLRDSGERYDIILCLQPTTPLRTSAHIDGAIDRFIACGANSLMSLKEQDYPPWWMFELRDERIKLAFALEGSPNVFRMQRQQFSTVYRPNGAIYLTWVEHLLRTGDVIDADDCAYFLMPEECSISIDTAVHFATADALARRLSGADG
jgi:CMP-N-acetylneuraminic acid synthetase